MLASTGLCKVVKGHFNQENVVFGETAGIQCACMALFAIFYSTLKEISRCDQSDVDIVLVNGDALYKTLASRTLLTAEYLPRNFELSSKPRKLNNRACLLSIIKYLRTCSKMFHMSNKMWQ